MTGLSLKFPEYADWLFYGGLCIFAVCLIAGLMIAFWPEIKNIRGMATMIHITGGKIGDVKVKNSKVTGPFSEIKAVEIVDAESVERVEVDEFEGKSTLAPPSKTRPNVVKGHKSLLPRFWRGKG